MSIRRLFEHKKIGDRCSFGEGSSFGERCSFGQWCSFGERCSVVNIKIKNRFVVAVFGIGDSNSLYRWLSHEDVNYFQVGCFFGTEKELIQRITEKYGSDHIYYDAIEFIKKIPVV